MIYTALGFIRYLLDIEGLGPIFIYFFQDVAYLERIHIIFWKKKKITPRKIQ